MCVVRLLLRPRDLRAVAASVAAPNSQVPAYLLLLEQHVLVHHRVVLAARREVVRGAHEPARARRRSP